MTDNKLTDEQIIKALECCITNDCAKCKVYDETNGEIVDCVHAICRNAFDLINRQKAEIEKLQIELKSMRGACNSYKREADRKQKWIVDLQRQIEDEKQKVAGYEQVAMVHSAYISILLKKLGATKDNVINIEASEVKEALAGYESRAIATDNGFGLYYEEVKKE